MTRREAQAHQNERLRRAGMPDVFANADRRSQKCLRAFSWIVTWWLISLFFVAPSTAQPAPRSVLVLDQYSGSLPWVSARNASFRTLINTDRKRSVSIYEEFLDLNRFAAQAYKESLTLHLGVKYRDKPIDLIVAFGPLAFEYAVAIRAELWPKAPLVFGEIAETAISRSNIPTATTGTTINITLGELVIAARAVVPDLKRIAIVGDLLERLPAYRHFKDEIPILARDLEFIDLTGLTMTDLRNRVSELPDHTAIIYTTINFDRAGVSYVPAEALSLVAEVANRPIVISTETFLGRGAVGGFVVTPGSVGRDAAQLASRILDGADPSSISVTTNSINEPVFDWRQLQRWKVDASRLPSNSEIRFRDPTVWDQYRLHILAIAATILLQAGLIAWLIYEHRRRHSAEITAREAMFELTQMNRIAGAGQLSASIAHEVNQPLAAIAANAAAAMNWLKAKIPDIDEAQAALARIASDSHRAGDIVANLRGLFRKDAQKKESVELNEVILSVLELVRIELQEYAIEVRTQLGKGLPSVTGSKVQLQQLVLNLVMNARDAMQSASQRKLLIKSERSEPDCVQVSIEDSGPGISPSDLEKLFQPMFTTKSNGMGMGLPICKSIVEAHHGRIWVETGSNTGAAFRFSLPGK